MATYTKLRSGEWGVRVQGKPAIGETVSVTTRAGATKRERIARVLWSGDGVSICAIEREGYGRSGSYGPRRRSACGCDCGCDGWASGGCDECNRNCVQF